MWDALKQVIKDSELYSKQLVFFMVVLAISSLGFGGYRYISNVKPQAATQLGRDLVPQVDTDAVYYDVVVSANAKVTVNARAVNGAISYESGQPHFLLVLNRKSATYIGRVRAVVHVPSTSVSAPDLNPRIYAVHGVGLANYIVIDNQTIAFEAQDVPESGTVSIGLTFPESYFGSAFIPRFEAGFSKLSPGVWLLLGLGFPFLTLVFLAVLLLRRNLVNYRLDTKLTISKVPDQASPGMVGALYHARIGAREITSTLFDLADRGFVVIYHGSDNELSFAKGSSLYSSKTAQLRPFEIFLLHQIFDASQTISKDSQIKAGLENELFSTKMAMTMVNLYDGLVGEGYYIASPNRYFLRYQLIGMGLFFIAAVGSIYGSFVLPEPSYVLFAWFGMMLASLLIVQSTPGMPTRTQKGTQVLRQWMAFRNYLIERNPVEGVQPSQFFDYLPYAIVLDCVDEWMTRWRNETIVLPHWLTAAQTPYSADDYKTSLISVIKYLSQHLLNARPPDLA